MERIEALKQENKVDDSTIELLSVALQTTAPSEYSKFANCNKSQTSNSASISLMSLCTDGLSHAAATNAYRNAIENNIMLYYGKTVLDLRGGTGKSVRSTLLTSLIDKCRGE